MGFIQIIEDRETFEVAMGDSVLVLRRLPADVHAKIREQHTTRTRTRQGEWAKDIDAHETTMACIDYVIRDWQNVTHPVTGQAVPCSAENKRKLPYSVMEKVLDAAMEAEDARSVEARASLGNSSGSSA